MWKDPDNPRPEPWYNRTEAHYFDTKRDAFAKMNELDRAGIPGWPMQLSWFREGKYDA